MITINVEGSDKSRVLNLPTTIDEITLDYLNGVTSDVRIEPNYALVALLVSDKLSTLCVPNNKKSIDVKAIAVLVRANDPNNVGEAQVGEKLICAPTDIMMGHEVTSPMNVLSPSKVSKLIASDKALLARIYSYTEPVWLVTFKLVPLNTIHGSYKKISEEEVKKQVECCRAYLM